MTTGTDPFRHHPELRGRIADPLGSFFRTFLPSSFDDRMRALGLADDWRYSDAEREANRRAFLAGRSDSDLWVFAYGSLMWDPAFLFSEVRQGSITGYARRFCLRDTFGARGTPERPGLQAGLDHGPGCAGLVFRVAAAHSDAESEVLWRREGIAPAYTPTFVTVTTAHGQIEALTFVANHASPVIVPNLERAEQVRYLATGAGFMGTSLQYIQNIAAQLAALGIEDADVTDLLAEAMAFAPDQGG